MPLTEQQKQRLNAIEELKRIKLVAEKVAKLQLKDVKQDVAQLEADLSNFKKDISQETAFNLANEIQRIEGLIENISLTPGEKGDKGDTPSEEEVNKVVSTFIDKNADKFKVKGSPGKDGKSPTSEDIKPIVLETFNELDLRGEPGKDGTDGFLDPVDVINVIETLEGDERLDAKVIKNLEENIDLRKTNLVDIELDASQIRNLPESKTVIKGGGGSSGIDIRKDGVNQRQGASNINFTGSGVTLTPSPNGVNVAIDGSSEASELERDVRTITEDDTATTDDDIILADASSNTITVTLPTAVGISGRRYDIKKIDSSANTVTIDGNGSETIDGDTTQVIQFQNTNITVVSNSQNWVII